ncbi:MAG: 2-hydroxyacyl-CoA dehydratase family protein [Candidatus Eremiobacteraeota bacterium]|nr:2-hydroxyacyl-CoA dehydratase family protein [Candidatus Eremiobacteraeota bacterium]
MASQEKPGDKYAQALKSLGELASPPEARGLGELLEHYREKSRLKSSAFFYEVLAGGIHDSRKRVGYFCNLVPDELIIACGALPVRLCSHDPCWAKCGEALLSPDLCPALKSTAGEFAGKAVGDLDLLIVPAACDGKAKLAELLSPFVEICFLDIPRDSDYLASAGHWEERYRALFGFLRKRYQVKAGRKDLLRACDAVNKRTSVFRKIYRLRASQAGAVSTFDYFIMAQASFHVDPLLWSEKAGALLEEALGAGREEEKGKRIVLAGSPVLFPSFKVLEVLEEARCHVAADTICSTYGRLYDPVQVDEETELGILRSLALKHIAASMCPCLIGVSKLLDRIIDLTGEYRLDGVVYHSLHLCQVFEMQSSLVRQVLKERAMPFLSLQADFAPGDKEQLRTRVEAFMEMIP